MQPQFDPYPIRLATAQDLWPIRKLVFAAKLDPTQIRWQQFWVIEQDGQVIACGQLRDFGDAQELGSLVVRSDWRDRGLGRMLTEHLIQQATKPLYLECLGQKLAQFYSQFGFHVVNWQTLPSAIRRKFRITHLLATLFRLPLFIMHRD